MVKHVIPKSLKEALEYLDQGNYKIIAGGTDLMIQNRAWSETAPKFNKNIIYALNLKELNYIKTSSNDISYGAMTSYEKILNTSTTPELFKKIFLELAAPGLRYVATIAGNIGNASPAGDALVGLYLYDATVTLENLKRKRTVKIDELITGPKKAAIEENEMITEITIPKLSAAKTEWIKVGGRRADAISKVSFAGLVDFNDDIIKDIRLALGAVNATVVRERSIEEKMIGMTKSEVKESIEEIIDAYTKHVNPIDDQRSTAKYRKFVALNMVRNFILNL